LNKFFEKLRYFDPADITNQVFLITLSVIIAICNNKIEYWYLFVILNITISIVIFYFIVRYEKQSIGAKGRSKFTKAIRFWYIIFVILLFFKEIYLIMINLEPVFYDDILIKIDHYIFGVNPTQYLFGIHNPFLTEILQIVYGVFYLTPFIFGMELYLWNRFDEFKYAMFVIFFGFYLSFIGYLILPAIGPRFTLHNFANLSNELPGIFFTDILRDFVNWGESISKNIANPESIAQRDAFPSGHTEIILLIVYMSHKIKSNSFYFYLPYAILLMFSTIYLRYHYVIDVFAGAVFALITILITNWIYNRKSLISSCINRRE
jgi:membrane-associated phospholipid phosphatase